MMSVSGHEQRELKKIKALFGDGFDEIIADAPGNIMLVKMRQENAPKILVDTHFDEIGFCERNLRGRFSVFRADRWS